MKKEFYYNPKMWAVCTKHVGLDGWDVHSIWWRRSQAREMRKYCSDGTIVGQTATVKRVTVKIDGFGENT